MSGCNCGCSGSHSADCPEFSKLVGTLVAMRQGDGCGADGSNSAVLGIACSFGLQLAGTSDWVGRMKADMGMAPYRVFLVWELRVDGEEYTEVRRVELMPVEMRGLNEVRIVLGPDGRSPEGQVLLVGISPRQVSQDDLLGHSEGRAWDRDGERFFIETRLHELCAGRAAALPWRWTIDGVPELRTGRSPYGWMVRLTDQRVARGRHGEDRTTALGEQPEGEDMFDRIRV